MASSKMAFLGGGCRGDLPAVQFGNKASMLARIGALPLRIPPAFVLDVSVCEDYFANGRELPSYLPDLIKEGIDHLQRSSRLQYGGDRRPLLVSVRSGTSVSMPGMMSTILNVGLNSQAVGSLIARSGNPRFGWDCYRRLISSYAQNVAHHDPRHYDRLLTEKVLSLGVGDETELDSRTLRSLTEEYEAKFASLEGSPFPQDPQRQLSEAISAVLDSWASPRVEAYRKMGLSKGARGTAVMVQAMVYGNMGFLSGAGVAFTRNPWTGENELVVDFRFGVQGEDVVSGEQEANHESRLKRLLPRVYKELQRVGKEVEVNLRDMQDIEFTIQEGELYILQTRDGKRTPLAALRIAVDLAEEKVITEPEAVDRIRTIDLGSLVEQKVVAEHPPLAKGTPASLGIVTGKIALSTESAVNGAMEGPVILVRETLTPDDLSAVSASAGVITAHGNRMAHAIVVARQLDKACIVNVPGLSIDPQGRSLVMGGKRFREGALLSMDSRTGEIFEGTVRVLDERPTGLLAKIEEWGRGPFRPPSP